MLDPKHALLLTAAHNLDYAMTFDPYVRRSPPAAVAAGLVPAGAPTLGTTSIYAVLSDVQPALVAYSWWRDNSDVALMLVELPDDPDHVFDARLPIDTRDTIPMGTEVTAVGFPDIHGEFIEPPDYENAKFRVRLSTKFEGRGGRVVGTATPHGIHRGGGVLVDCAFAFGMSGGPLLENRNGRAIVRAVVSADLDGQDAEDSSMSARAFAGLLLPALSIKADNLTLETETRGVLNDPFLLDIVGASLIEDLGESDKHVRLVE
ncbi:MAG: trypsin-like peptidase domain-containing protein [Deltaproteobacteria bacterium]|nr:trypsin-like peptidase domain-containing protein [Deltaproteobacteria bacterium]